MRTPDPNDQWWRREDRGPALPRDEQGRTIVATSEKLRALLAKLRAITEKREPSGKVR